MKMSAFVVGGILVLGLLAGCGGGVGNSSDSGPPPAPPCTGGTDTDGDKYGPGCPAGPDCDEADPLTHPAAKEYCDNKDNNCNGQIDDGAKNACGTCDPNCKSFGSGTPFPTDSKSDPNVKDVNGVKTDPNGDLVLDQSAINFNYIWIANTYDMGGSGECSGGPLDKPNCRGTVSKVDTVALKEIARYYSTICSSATGPTGCADVNGLPINKSHNHTPSRTAVDFNFDCWVANRNVHGGQPSATKIANDSADCVDRNHNGKIDTSKDQDGDGHINTDCNADGQFDTAATACANGKPPEFLGDDDECILFTVNYAEPNDIGRSICLDTGKNNVGASNAWVGTYSRTENGRGNNRFYSINGNTGKIEATVEIVAGHRTYGCMADAHHIIWSTDINGADGKGSMTFFHSMSPYETGPLMRGPTAANHWKDWHGGYKHYGISINADQHVWLGGYDSGWVLRYKPNRASFATLSQGTWSRFDLPADIGGHRPVTRGIAADNRGKVWVSVQNGGYIFRLDQSLPDGTQTLSGTNSYWKLTADTVIGSGVDFNGNVWGVGHGNDYASRIEVDAKGEVTSTASKNVKIGRNPYTYSDFTGYGLMNFVRPQGRYVFQHSGCNGEKVNWNGISWKATTPTGTAVICRVRTGDSETSFGPWSQEFAMPPAEFGPLSKTPVQPNPAKLMQVEFTLKNQNKDTTPILHEYGIAFSCGGPPS